MFYQQELLDERTLTKGKKVRKSGTMDIPGSEGAARRDVSRAGFRKRGPVQEPKIEKSGKDVPVWVRTHSSPRDYAAHTARKQHREGGKPQSKELKKQFGKTGAKKDSPVHDVTVGSPKSRVKDPGQRARQFVGALKNVKDNIKSKKGVATNTPTAIDSANSKGKKSRSGEEGAEQRGRIYKKLGMGERNPKTGVQMAKLNDSFGKKTFGEFMCECYVVVEVNRPESGNDVEKTRWDKVRASIDARDKPGDYMIGSTGRDKDGNRTYGSKKDSSRQEQGKRRRSRLADVDSDLDSKQKSRGDAKATKIKGRGKEHHHLTQISQSAKEFKGLTPEQRKEKREKDAKFGKFHGSDPRNIAQTDGPEGGKGISHRGAGGYHSSQKAVGKGGSIQDIGSEKEIIAQQRSTAASKRRTGMTHQQRLAKEKGIETPKMLKQRDQRARMDVSGRANNLPERG